MVTTWPQRDTVKWTLFCFQGIPQIVLRSRRFRGSGEFTSQFDVVKIRYDRKAVQTRGPKLLPRGLKLLSHGLKIYVSAPKYFWVTLLIDAMPFLSPSASEGNEDNSM